MQFKGQSSVEYTMVIGLALILASPFLISSQSSIIQLDEASDYLEIDNSLDRLETTASTLNQKSYPARRVIEFSTPRGVERIYNPNFDPGSAVVLQTSMGDSTSNTSVIFDFNVSISDISDLSETGRHRLSMKKFPEGVNVSVIS